MLLHLKKGLQERFKKHKAKKNNNNNNSKKAGKADNKGSQRVQDRASNRLRTIRFGLENLTS